jgi:hypothetical protein
MSLENVRVKKALKDAGMTIDDVFAPYKMEYKRGMWWPGPTHPLTYMLDVGQPMGAACKMAGDSDAQYAFPPPNKPPPEEPDGTTDQ